MLHPELTIIIPVYKVEDYLDRCIKSVLQQTFSDWELILVDDGSPDQCGKICDRYAGEDRRIRVLHTSNGGQSRARNLALDLAHGRFITFVDADDYILDKQTLEYAMNVFEENPHVDMVTFPHICVDSDGNEILDSQDVFKEEQSPVLISDKAYFISHLGLIKTIQPCYIVSTPWAKIFRKELWEEIRFPEGMIFEDAYVLCDIIPLLKTVAFTNKGCYYYNYNPSSSLRQAVSKERFFYRINVLLHYNEALFNLTGNNCIPDLIYYLVQGKHHWGNEVDITSVCNQIDNMIKMKGMAIMGKSGMFIKIIGTKNLVLLKILYDRLKGKSADLHDF